MGSGVHCVDLLRFVLGKEVVEVRAMTDATQSAPLEHLAAVLLRFEDGTIATATAGRRVPESRNDVVVYGSLGRGEFRQSLFTDLEGTLEINAEGTARKETYAPSDPLAMYTSQVEAFNQAVVSGTEPVGSGWDGLKVAEVTLAMVESATTGRMVLLG